MKLDLHDTNQQKMFLDNHLDENSFRELKFNKNFKILLKDVKNCF